MAVRFALALGVLIAAGCSTADPVDSLPSSAVSQTPQLSANRHASGDGESVVHVKRGSDGMIETDVLAGNLEEESARRLFCRRNFERLSEEEKAECEALLESEPVTAE